MDQYHFSFRNYLSLRRIVFLLVVIACFISTQQSNPIKADESTTGSIYFPLFLSPDPISGYLAMVNQDRLTTFTSNLVTIYGPRHHNKFKVFIDRNCTLGGTLYGNSNLIRSSNYVKQYLESLGYSITKEVEIDSSGGYNIIAQKLGNRYPDVFIEIGAHIDTKDTTPGASDNAAGIAGIMEMATVLQNYANQYSLRFISFIGEEYGRTGSKYHTQQAVNRGEQIKAGLVLDGIGWSERTPVHMNCLWDNNTSESRRISNLFNSVRAEYEIDIDWRLCSATKQVSDNVSYWEHNLTSVLSIGGLPYVDPNYHTCTDDMVAVDMVNAFKTIQQNLVVALILDGEPWSPPLGLEQPSLEPFLWPGEGH